MSFIRLSKMQKVIKSSIAGDGGSRDKDNIILFFFQRRCSSTSMECTTAVSTGR
jgi:hypothetical protein